MNRHEPGRGESVASLWKTRELIQRYGLTLKKSLGQNFLVDSNILEKIVDSAALDRSVGVLEIGPGIGALTQRLAERAGKVVAVEIDSKLIPVLKEVLAPYENTVVLHQDILKTDLPALFEEHFTDIADLCVVANLPYYATTPILMHLFKSEVQMSRYILMMQKEVADRLAAIPGGKDYGSLTVVVQYYCEVEKVMTVPRTVFIPRPQVDSAVVRLTRRDQPPVKTKDETFLFEVVRAAFAQRRKTLYNNLLSRFFRKEDKDKLITLLERCGIESSRRGETLTMEEFARLSDELLPLVNESSNG